MDQDAPPPRAAPSSPPPALPHDPVSPAAPLLQYGRPSKSRMRVDEYLADFLAAAVLVAVVLITLHWMTDRMKRVYADFGLKLPRPTMLLLDLSDASRACYGWVLLAIVPFVAPFVLTRLPRGARRWVATLVILLVGVFVIFAMFAMFEPMITIMTKISGKR